MSYDSRLSRFQVVHVGRGEYAVVDTDVAEDGQPYTMCSGYRGGDAERYADAARDALNSGSALPDPAWYRAETNRVRDEWTSVLAEEEPDIREQVGRDIASGRLRVLDGDGVQCCDEVQAMRAAPHQRCHRRAVVFDTVRGRNQCTGDAINGALRRRDGNPEYPLLEG